MCFQHHQNHAVTSSLHVVPRFRQPSFMNVKRYAPFPFLINTQWISTRNNNTSSWNNKRYVLLFLAYFYGGCDVLVVIVRSLDLELPICNQCISPLARCTRYNIMWWNLSIACDRSLFFSRSIPVTSTNNKTDHHYITEILLKVESMFNA